MAIPTPPRHFKSDIFDLEEDIDATVVYLHPERKPVELTIDVQRLIQEPLRARRSEELRWIHLPANNMVWVERIVSKVYEEEREASQIDDPEMADLTPLQSPSTTKQWDSRTARLLAPKRWVGRQYDNPEASPGARFMKPLFTRVSTKVPGPASTIPQRLDRKQPRDLALFMPYLHWETFSAYRKGLESVDDAVEGIVYGLHKSPTESYLHSPYTKAKWQRQKAIQRMKKDQYEARLAAEQFLESSKDLEKDEREARKKELALHIKEIVDREQNEFDIDDNNLAREELEGKLIAKYIDYYDYYRANDEQIEWNSPLLLQPLHLRRTLDRSYYYALEESEIRRRDVDQVLYRHTMKELEMWDPRLIMVDQLWLWIIDDRTIITAFPQRWACEKDLKKEDRIQEEWIKKGKKQAEIELEAEDASETQHVDHTDVHARVMTAVRKDSGMIESAETLASIILDKCSGVFFPETGEEDDFLDYLDVFAISIARLAFSQAQAFNEFCDDQRRPTQHSNTPRLPRFPTDADLRKYDEHRSTCIECSKHMPKKRDFWFHYEDGLPEHRYGLALPEQPGYELHRRTTEKVPQRKSKRNQRSLVDITEETEYVKEIKDIMDELTSVARVFEQQYDLLSSRPNDDEEEDVELYSSGAAASFEEVEEKIKLRLDKIKQLQKEADRVYKSLVDLLDLKQRQASVQQADDTAQQGLTVLVFTIITIIFSPLSFIAGLFSMNAIEINQDRPLSHIWRIMFPVTVAVVLLSLLLVYSISPTLRIVDQLLDVFFRFYGDCVEFFWRGSGGTDSRGDDAKRRREGPTPAATMTEGKFEHEKNGHAGIFKRKSGRTESDVGGMA